MARPYKKLWPWNGKEYTIDELCKLAKRSRRSFDGLIKKGWSIDQIMNNKPIHHGLSGTRLHEIWKRMKQRCYNPNSVNNKNYYARGIVVCDEWKHDFEAFHDWAMDHGYADDLTIDRIDNNKGYSPDNCRWVDKTTQNNNQQKSIRLKYNGEWLSIRQIAQIEDISWNSVYWKYVQCKKTKLPIKYLYEGVKCEKHKIQL